MNAQHLVLELESAGVHLWEETGALRFRAPKGVMTESQRRELQAQRGAVLEFLKRRPVSAPALIPSPGSLHEPFPLTEIQRAYLLGRSHAFAYGGVGCHGYAELSFDALEPGRLTAAWRALIRRHAMLRAIVSHDGQQRVLASVPEYRIPVLDLRSAASEAFSTELRRVRAEMDHRVYDPEQWPLFDLRITLGADAAVLHFSIDLLIADFVSTQLLIQQLLALYDANGEADASPLPPLELSFRDYLLAAQELRRGKRFERDREYWMRKLDALPSAPELPIQELRNPARIAYERRTLRLSPEAWRCFGATAGRYELTSSSLMLQAFAETIGRWSRRPRFTLNITLQNRLPLHPEVNELVGDFTTLSLLGVDLSEGRTLLERTRALQARLWEDRDHMLFSGSEVMRELARRRPEEPVLFPVVFTSSIGSEITARRGPGLGDVGYGITQTPQVLIDCQVMESENGLVVNWDYRTGVFPDGLLDSMFTAFQGLLERLSRGEEALSETSPVGLPSAEAERRARANASRGPLPDLLLHEGILGQAALHPERPAIFTSDRQLTFGELVERAALVEDALVRAHVGPGERVGILLEKGCDQPVGLLGVLSAGCVYVPLDVDQPPARRDAILSRAQIRVVLTDAARAGLETLPEGVREIPIARRLTHEAPRPSCSYTRRAHPDDPAYVIFTSGSTGIPKGVVISHQAAMNTILEINRLFDVSAGDRVLGLSSLSFDLSVYDLFGPLSVGGALVLPDPSRRADPSHWAALIANRAITLWNSVPAQLQMLYDYLTSDAHAAAELGSLRLALLSGDWIPVKLPDQIRAMLPQLRVISLGGATEAAIWSIHHPIDDVSPEWRSIPYGRALRNQSVDVLDFALRPCPEWTAGEIYIGGAGLALEYLGDEEATQARFVRHPETHERLYRTGDYGRWLPEGYIEFLGREDRQVKIKGHRIELAEVEAAFRGHPDVASASVLADGAPTERRLVAFVEAARRPRQEGGVALDGAGIARQAGAALSALAAATYARSLAALEAAGLASMLHCLHELCLGADGAYPEQMLVDSIAPRYAAQVRRWLSLLTQAGWLEREPLDAGYRAKRSMSRTQLDAMWSAAEAACAASGEQRLARRLGAFAVRLPDALRATGGARHPLLSELGLPLLEAVHQDALPARWARAIAEAILEHTLIAPAPAGEQRSRPLRVLVLGAWVAPVLQHRAAKADSATAEIDIWVTDQSPAALKRAMAASQSSSAARFALFDPAGDYRQQGLLPNSYDVIWSHNALHGVRNAPKALETLIALAAPGGLLLLAEMTRQHAATAATLELLREEEDGLEAERQAQGATHEIFVSSDQWREALERAGSEQVLCLPEDEQHPLARSGMRLFVAAVKHDRARVELEELRHFIARKIPDYMVPSEIQLVDSLPLTDNGKIDQRRLRTWIDAKRPAPQTQEPSGAQSEFESRVASLWSEVLGIPHPGRSQGFLELGGDSLTAARLAGRLRESLPEARLIFFDQLLRQILDGGSVATLASALAAANAADPTGPAPAAAPERPVAVQILSQRPDKPYFVLAHDGSGSLDAYGTVPAHLMGATNVLGLVVESPGAFLQIPAEGLLDQTSQDYLDALIDGGYLDVHVVGIGRAAGLAFEVAIRLWEAGAIVRQLVLLAEVPSEREHARNACAVHWQRAAAGWKATPYSGDVTILHPSGSTTRGELETIWRQHCLGDFQSADAANDEAIAQALLDLAGAGASAP